MRIRIGKMKKKKRKEKKVISGPQKILVVLNYARLHYKTVVQLKSKMKYYLGKEKIIYRPK